VRANESGAAGHQYFHAANVVSGGWKRQAHSLEIRACNRSETR